MRMIIAGTRSLYGPEGEKIVREAIKESGWTPTEIISGNARGVDTIGEEIAKEEGIDLTIFPANWKKYGKAAGYKRNEKMAWYANIFNKQYVEDDKWDEMPDKLKGCLVAVWNGTSTGTKNMIEIAEGLELPVYTHLYSSEKDS